MLVSNGEKDHVSNVNVKLDGTLSINNTHLRRENNLEVKQIKSNIR